MDRASIKTAVIIAILIFGGRVIGLLRDLLIASMYGASRTADQLFILQTFPDILSNLLAGGAIIYVLTPVFTRLSNDQIPTFFWKCSLVALSVTGTIALVIGLIFPSLTIDMLAPGFSVEEQQQITPFVVLFALIFPMTVLAGVAAARLQGQDKFYAAAAGALFVNCSLVFGLYFGQSNIFFAFGLAGCCGAIIRYFVLLISIWRSPNISENAVARTGIQTVPAAPQLAFRYAQALLAGGFLILLPYLSRIFVSDQVGEIALFSYSIKLVDLPLGVAITILPVILLPRMARALASESGLGTGKYTLTSPAMLNRLSVYANLSLSMAIVLPSIYYCRTIVDIVYGWASLNELDLQRITKYARILLISLPAQGVIAHYISVLHAGQKTSLVTIITLITLVIFSVISFSFDQLHGLTGITIALVISYFCCALILYETTRRSLNWGYFNAGASPEIGFLLAMNFALSLVFISITHFGSSSLALNVVLAGLWGFLSLVFSTLFLKHKGSQQPSTHL